MKPKDCFYENPNILNSDTFILNTPTSRESPPLSIFAVLQSEEK